MQLKNKLFILRQFEFLFRQLEKLVFPLHQRQTLKKDVFAKLENKDDPIMSKDKIKKLNLRLFRVSQS